MVQRGIAVLLQPELFHMLQVIKRHGSGVRFFSDDNMLSETTHQFSSLRRQLRTSHENISLSMCLAPFRSLFRLTDCSSAILASALGSVAKLLRSGIFGLFREDEAILEFRRLIMIIAECRLDGGELSGDETALQRLLDVLLLAMKSSSLSVCFGDAEVCKIIETCFSVCVLPRVGELFRRHAELCCLQLSGILLGRVRELATAQAMPLMGVLKIAYPGTRADDPEPLPPALAALEAELEREKKEKEKEKEEGTIPLTDEPTSLAPPPTTTPTSPISSIGDDGASVMVDSPIEVVTPYSMAAIMEFLSHLLRLLEVGEARNTDRMRSLCLAILSDFVERNYDFLPDCSLLWDFIYAQLDRVLIQLLLLESPSLQVHLHQTILSVFGRFRRRLIAPTELLISTLIGLLQQRPAPGKQPRIAREYYLDMMSFFCLDGDFLADIYVLYECGRKFGDTLEDFIGALVNIVQLDPKQVTGQDYFLALEIIIQILQALDAAGTLSECTPDPEKLRADRNLKLLMRRSAELFNEDPKEAFTFLAEHGLTSSPPTPQEIAQYLRRTPGLDKKAIGEIVAKPSNVELLKEFLADFHFAGLRIDEALRVVLESFRLPGEAQQISRIMESLAQLYYRSHTGEVFKNEDAVFVLAYSIVMLNTDQHNKQVRHKMSVEEFIRNNRGTNDGADFEQSFIRRIYHAIQSKEIVMPEEQAGEMAFHYTWNEQLKKQSSTAEPPHLALDGYAPDIMRLLWRPFLGCFRTLILNPKSETGSRLAVRGLGELGSLAGRFLDEEHLNELTSVLVECLAFVDVANNPAGNQLARYMARSELFKTLLRCFFDLYRYQGEHYSMGWKPFVVHILMLVQASMVTLATFQVEIGTTLLSPGPGATPQPVSPRESGLFSTLSSYLVSSPVDHSGVDSETKERALNFLASCKLDEIIRDSRFLPSPSLQHLIMAMTDQLVISKPLLWDVDTLVFLVDLVVHTAWINRDRMSTFWPGLFGRFSELAKDLSVPGGIREHVILGLGRLSLRFADRPEMQREVVQFFQLLCYVPTESFQHLAEPALSIVLRIVELDPPILHGTAIWPHYFTVLALAGRSKSCGPYSFGLLTTIVREGELLFPLEFYSEYVDLLSGFIASCSYAQQPSGSPLSASGDIVPSPVELAGQALNKFALLEANIRRLATSGQIPLDTLWHDLLIPIHCALAQQSYHPVREIRQQALSLLQRIILGFDFARERETALFEEFQLVLLPLLEELQRPELRRLEGLEELQVRAASVVSRILLTNLPHLPQTPPTATLWSTLLSTLLGFLGGGDLLRESIPETIKNMLMVMTSAGYLRPDGLLWGETWRMVDEVLPGEREMVEKLMRDRKTGGESVQVGSIQNPVDQDTMAMDKIVTDTIATDTIATDTIATGMIVTDTPATDTIVTDTPATNTLGRRMSTPNEMNDTKKGSMRRLSLDSNSLDV